MIEHSHNEQVKFETKLQVIEILVLRSVQACGFDVLAFKGGMRDGLQFLIGCVDDVLIMRPLQQGANWLVELAGLGGASVLPAPPKEAFPQLHVISKMSTINPKYRKFISAKSIGLMPFLYRPTSSGIMANLVAPHHIADLSSHSLVFDLI